MINKKLVLSASLVVLGCTTLALTLTGCSKHDGWGGGYNQGFFFPQTVQREVGVGVAGDGGDGTDGECAGCDPA